MRKVIPLMTVVVATVLGILGPSATAWARSNPLSLPKPAGVPQDAVCKQDSDKRMQCVSSDASDMAINSPGGPKELPPPAQQSTNSIGVSGWSECLNEVIAQNWSAVVYIDRLGTCSANTMAAWLFECVGSQCTQIGSIYWIVFQWVDYNNPSLTWVHEVDEYVTYVDGVYAEGVSLTVGSICGYATTVCQVTSSWGETSFLFLPGRWYQGYFRESTTFIPSPGSPLLLTRKIGGTFDLNDGFSPMENYGRGPNTNPTLAGRCDSEGSSSGCVDEKFAPTLVYSAVQNPLVGPVADHVFNAQQSLPSRWGVPAYGNALSRTTNSYLIAQNRSVACANIPPSCDEFPLASTYQGASLVDPDDFSAVTVPASANNSQGGITSTFYRTNRMLDGDWFWVKAIKADGTASW